MIAKKDDRELSHDPAAPTVLIAKPFSFLDSRCIANDWMPVTAEDDSERKPVVGIKELGR